MLYWGSIFKLIRIHKLDLIIYQQRSPKKNSYAQARMKKCNVSEERERDKIL